MSELSDRLIELAAWCEQHSYEVPVTAREDCMAAAKELERLAAERDEARHAAWYCWYYADAVGMGDEYEEMPDRWPWLETTEDAEGGEI